MNRLQLRIDDFEERFLPGTPISDFKQNTFRKRAELFDSGNAEFFSELFRYGDLTKLLEGTMLHRPSIRMVGKGKVVPMSEISYSVPYGIFSFENIVDIEKVGEWYKKGYTINVRGAHYNHAGLAKCTSLLQRIFSCNIRSNLYLTPTAESGLVPHYDVHDVFVVQVHGCKRWQLFSNNFDRPTENFVSGVFAPRCHGCLRLRGDPDLMMGSAFRNVRYKFVSQIAGRRDLRVGPSPMAG